MKTEKKEVNDINETEDNVVDIVFYLFGI